MKHLLFLPNLHADLELMDPGAFVLTPGLQAETTRQAERLLADLRIATADRFSLLDPGSKDVGRALGQAWCPTPRALTALQDAGAFVPDAPDLVVLQRVNHRRFAVELSKDATLPGTHFVWDMAELKQAVAPPSVGDGYLLKRPFGFSGRARKRLASANELTGAMLTWAEASMQSYGRGLLIEPYVERVADFALHGWVDRGGAHRLGPPTLQMISPEGHWEQSRPAKRNELSADEQGALQLAGADTAQALQTAGYFGPFGIDAFRWRDREGRTHFCPRCDLNARYTMAFFCDPRISAVCPWLR